MEMSLKNKRILGINGIGRIGKLTLWNHLNLRHFDPDRHQCRTRGWKEHQGYDTISDH